MVTEFCINLWTVWPSVLLHVCSSWDHKKKSAEKCSSVAQQPNCCNVVTWNCLELISFQNSIVLCPV